METQIEEEENSEINEAAYKEKLEHKLALFWHQQLAEMDALDIHTEQDFKNYNDLPLARIKRIMKSDEDVRMISAEAPGNI